MGDSEASAAFMGFLCGATLMGLIAFAVSSSVPNDVGMEVGAIAHARGECVVDFHTLPDGREVVTVVWTKGVADGK